MAHFAVNATKWSRVKQALNPIEKAIGRAEALRKESKRNKILQIRQRHRFTNFEPSPPTAPYKTEINLVYMNIRGANSANKIANLTELIQAQSKVDILCLTETKLKKQLNLSNYFKIQTRLSNSAGCWSGITEDFKVKNIKTMKEHITWQALSINNTPIHIINCYLRPQDPRSKAALHDLDHILELICGRLPTSRVILCGDFNEHRVQVETIARKFRLTPQIPSLTPTHNRGGHLDQIITNLPTKNLQLLDTQISDHAMIALTLSFEQTPSDVNLKNPPLNLSSKKLRSLATSQTTIEKMIHPEFTFREPLLNYLQSQIKPQRGIKHWYRKRQNENNNEHHKFQNWDDAVKEIETYHRKGDQKLLHSKIRQLTKVRQPKQLIRGIINDDESISFDQAV